MYQQDDFDTKIIKNFLSLMFFLFFLEMHCKEFFYWGGKHDCDVFYYDLKVLYNIICSSPIFLHYLSLASEQLKWNHWKSSNNVYFYTDSLSSFPSDDY